MTYRMEWSQLETGEEIKSVIVTAVSVYICINMVGCIRCLVGNHPRVRQSCVDVYTIYSLAGKILQCK